MSGLDKACGVGSEQQTIEQRREKSLKNPRNQFDLKSVDTDALNCEETWLYCYQKMLDILYSYKKVQLQQMNRFDMARDFNYQLDSNVLQSANLVPTGWQKVTEEENIFMTIRHKSDDNPVFGWGLVKGTCATEWRTIRTSNNYRVPAHQLGRSGKAGEGGCYWRQNEAQNILETFGPAVCFPRSAPH